MENLDHKIMNLLDAWRANPCGATHAPLIAAMSHQSSILDRQADHRRHYSDDGTEDGYYIHPHLRDVLLAYSAVAA